MAPDPEPAAGTAADATDSADTAETIDATGSADVAETADAGQGDGVSAGRYRLRAPVRRAGRHLVCRRPLAVTRLNDAGAAVVAELDAGAFRTPRGVAADTANDPGAVAALLARLHDRGFLEWAPARDESFTPAVSVVVTVRNQAGHLGACLDALAALEYPDVEVVVVDDGSTDGTRAVAAGHALADRGRLRVVEVGSPGEPLGIGASRNRGVEAASGEVVAFTDADCRPRPDWLSALVPALAAHDVVGGRVRPAGDAAVDAYEAVASSLDMGERAARVDPDGATPYLPTANLLARRAVLAEVPFPARNVAEDVGFCWRALDAGYDVVYDPGGVVAHDFADGLRGVVRRRATYGASEALLAREAGPTGDRVPVSLALLAGVAVAVLAGAGAAVTGGRPGLPAVAAAGVAGGCLAWVAAGLVRYAGVAGAVGPRAVFASRLRGLLSTGYALARETARYYGLPLAVLFAALGATGHGSVAVAGGVLLALAVLLAAAVEYAVATPALPRHRFLGWWLADQVAYGAGVYRGSLAHRTLAAVLPWRRFRLPASGSPAE